MNQRVLVAAVVLASSLLACGGRTPPNAAVKPAGSGWYCFTAGCARTAEECQQNKDKLMSGLSSGAAQLFAGSECQASPEAYCFTYVDGGTPGYLCTRGQEQCSKRSDSVSFDQVSTCEAWR